jgi:AraC family transcriptional regulator, regulatory protein of adaptative response / methylated-DNA-[protein]-cysteine methyltransferase
VIAGDKTHLDLPLDIRGTAFQKQVWQALQKIPYSQTRTYTDIARDIAKPQAVRAVGNACGANPIALIVPCHRVLRSDGSLGGYRWGIERKQKLLIQESQR